MADKKKLVVIVTNGFNDERSSVSWSVANGGVASGMEVTMFLVSSGVDRQLQHLDEIDEVSPLCESNLPVESALVGFSGTSVVEHQTKGTSLLRFLFHHSQQLPTNTLASDVG